MTQVFARRSISKLVSIPWSNSTYVCLKTYPSQPTIVSVDCPPHLYVFFPKRISEAYRVYSSSRHWSLSRKLTLALSSLVLLRRPFLVFRVDSREAPFAFSPSSLQHRHLSYFSSEHHFTWAAISKRCPSPVSGTSSF